MAMGRAAALAIGGGALAIGSWASWRAVVNIVALTTWTDGIVRVVADVFSGLIVGGLIGGLVMVAAVGASFVAHAVTPRAGGTVLIVGGVVAAVSGVLAGLLSFAARPPVF